MDQIVDYVEDKILLFSIPSWLSINLQANPYFMAYPGSKLFFPQIYRFQVPVTESLIVFSFGIL